MHETFKCSSKPWFAARPIPIKEADQKADILAEFARRNGPQAAKGLMLGLPGDRQPDRQQLLAAAARTTVVPLLPDRSDSGLDARLGVIGQDPRDGRTANAERRADNVAFRQTAFTTERTDTNLAAGQGRFR